MTTERRAFIGKLAASGIALAAATRPPETSSPPPGSMRNVRAFGAKGDGVTDDTAAFNAATDASVSIPREGAGIGIFVPPGTYRIDGTIWLRKGQTLTGAGDASVIDASRARGRTVVLGHDIHDKEDPGGAPVTVGELRFFGGSDRAPLIQASLAGFAIRNLFITSAGIALEIGGGDGIVSNVIIDQALNGIILRGARNVLISNIICYSANYAITVDRATNDVALAGLVIAYSKNASMLFAEGAADITSIRVAGCTFVSSIEYGSFVGHVHARAETFDAQFSDCVFRNWRGFAVTQEAGSGARLSFSNCTFDGARSHPSYNASASASGIRTGIDGSFRLDGCRFRRLLGPIASIGPGLRDLTFDGGLVEECRGDPIQFAAKAGGHLRIRGVDGFGRRLDQGTTSSLILPWTGTTTAWRVRATRRGSPGGMAQAVVAACEKGDMVTCSISDGRQLGEPLAIVCGFGEGRNGPQQTRFGRGSGTLCITVPASDIDWTVETLA